MQNISFIWRHFVWVKVQFGQQLARNTIYRPSVFIVRDLKRALRLWHKVAVEIMVAAGEGQAHSSRIGTMF